MKTNKPVLMRLIVAAACVVIFLAGCQGAEEKSVQVGEADAGKTIELRSGQELVIVLEGNPTTGFTWETQPGLDEAVLKPASEPQFKADSNAVGSGGKMTLTYTAGQPGQVDLTLLYLRPWEKNIDPEKEFNIVVRVVK